MPEEMLYTVKEVSQILHTNPNYVYSLRDAGLLKFLKLGSLRVRKATLEEFLQQYDGMDLSDPFHPKPIEIGGAKGCEEQQST